jgi:predicted kinase
MTTLYMLIGVPGSGKSFWISQQDLIESVVLSTDHYIEKFAQLNNQTYSEIFNKVVGEATRLMREDLRKAILDKKTIYWDQTNTTRKSRAQKLSQIPKTYRKIAVFFQTPDKVEHAMRLNSRPGKIIPDVVLENMIKSLEIPTIQEGFDEVIFA